MRQRLLAFFACCLLGASPAFAADGEQDAKDHEALRGLLKLFTESFNSRNVEPLKPYLHKDFSVTMVNQDVVTTPKALKAYLDSQFEGPQAILKDVRIEPSPDIPTVFFDGRFGINRGGSTDTYTLKDGRQVVLKTRWTGTAIKEGGEWKVLNAHIGLNILDNPILEVARAERYAWAAGAGAAGLALGILATLWFKRRRS